MPHKYSWQNLERLAHEIDEQIRLLVKQRTAILRMDPDYAEYLDAFGVCGEGAPLSIRQFHQYSDELDKISAKFAGGDVNYEAVWVAHRDRILELERLLLY